MKELIISIIIILTITHIPAQQPPEREATTEEIKMLEDQLRLEPESSEIMMKLGIIYHGLARKGDKKAVKKAEDIFKKLLQLEPKNAEALGWYGSVLTMRGRDEWLPLLKIKYVNDGLKKMDKSVELDSNNITVRMVRANTCLALPENIFHRTEVAVQDFEHLLSLREAQPDVFDEDLLASIYLGLGNAYKKKGDILKARANWQKVVDVAPNSEQMQEAKKLLADTEG